MSAPQLQFDADTARRIEALYLIRDAVHRRELVREALGAGVEAHAFVASGRDPERFGAALVPFIATFVAGRQGVGEAEAEAWGAEQRELMERDEFYFATTQFCFTATKSA